MALRTNFFSLRPIFEFFRRKCNLISEECMYVDIYD